MKELTINGEIRSVEAEPKMPLLWVLRDLLGLTGTKFGCGMGQCGACTVLVDGKARPSCTLSLEAAEGKEITTIEGINPDHPLKRAWVEEQVPQCGYCQSGQLLRAVSLLAEKPEPDEGEIERTMQSNLCRCGTYGRIKRAIRRASGQSANGAPRAEAVSAAPPAESAPPIDAEPSADAKRWSLNPFVSIGRDGTITVIAKHLEAGQGIYTGLATILAEELDADWERVRVEAAPADDRFYGNLLFDGAQGTGGSTSIANSYDQYREAGASARAMLVEAAAREWEVAGTDLEVREGVVAHPSSGRRVGFGELAERAAALDVPERPRLKAPEEFRLIGKRSKRIDVAAKVRGAAQYGIDLRLPGMLTAVVARPPRFGGRVASFDASDTWQVSGVVEVVEIPEGVAVVATNFWAATEGRAALRVEWDDSGAELRGTPELLEEYHALVETPGAVARSTGDLEGAREAASKRIEASYEFPYLAHTPLEPLNCVVELSEAGCEIWAGCQFQTGDRKNAAREAGVEVEQVQIHTLFAGGTFGRRANAPSDYIVEAVHVAKGLSQRAPVRLVWSREDDIKGGFYRPMFVHALEAGIDEKGNVISWLHRLAGQSILPTEEIDEGAIEGAFDMPYAVPNVSVELHTTQVGVPVLWWRSVGHSHTAFGVEAFLDEVAREAGRDPVDLRRELLADHPRHLGVLELAVERSGWGTPLPPGRFRGIAVHKSFGTYVAEVAEIALGERDSFSVERVVCAVDCGTPINPSIIRTQMEGGIAFGLSAALGEEITLDGGRVEQSDFNSYRLLRLGAMPDIEVHIVPSTEKPSGVGEPGVPPIAPAVANALLAATGKPTRRLPLLRR